MRERFDEKKSVHQIEEGSRRVSLRGTDMYKKDAFVACGGFGGW